MGWSYLEATGVFPADNAGSDALPNTQCESYELQEATDLAKIGSTINDTDLDLIKSQVETYVRQLIAEGRSDQEILQAVELLPYPLELRTVAVETAQKNLDAEKYNMFDDRNQQCQQDMQAIQQGVFGLAGLGLAANANEFSIAAGVTGGVTIPMAELCTLSPLQTPDCRDRGLVVGRA